MLDFSKMEKIADLPNGHELFRERNGPTICTYWSTEVAGGISVWQTNLVSATTLLTAISKELSEKEQS